MAGSKGSGEFLNAPFPQLPGMLDKPSMHDFLPLRAACTHLRDGLPSKMLVERLVDLIEPSREDVFVATGNLLMTTRRGASAKWPVSAAYSKRSKR